MHTYRPPRIRLSLRGHDVLVSEKVVRRLMKEEGVEVRYAKRKRRYSSYIGEIAPAVDDLVKRRFKAESPQRALAHGHHGVLRRGREAVPQPRHRLLRREGGFLGRIR